MSIVDDVRNASRQFYAALSRMANGDASRMAECWAHDAGVTAMHPLGGRQVGWDAIEESFEQFALLATEGKVELRDQVLQIGADMACEVGVEHGQMKLAGQKITLEHRVTNVYRHDDGAWKMIHHHTDVSPAVVDVIRRLQPPGKQAAK